MAKGDKVKVTIKGPGRSRVWNTGNGAVSLRKGGHYELPKRVALFFIKNGWALEGYVNLNPKGTAAVEKQRGRPKKEK